MRKLHLICFVALLSGTACSDEVEPNNGQPQDCPAGTTLNPITGSCGTTSNNGGGNNGANNGADAGNNGGADASNNGANNGADMGPDLSVDMGPDMLPSDCTGNERRCNGNVVEACVNGTFTVSQTCGAGTICERGNCIPDDAGSCTPGDTRCSGTTTFQTCEADGMTWGMSSTCPNGESCMGGVCTAGCAGLITEKSNVGCEYVTMRHNQATGLQVLPHSVVVSNPDDQAVTVQVSSPGGLNPGIPQQTIQPLDSVILNFPTMPMISTNGLSSNIYMIRSSRPVIATQFSPLNNPGLGSETSDASLLVPTNAVGTQYVVVGWRALQPGGTWVDIVAFEDGTTVTVESPLPLAGGAAGSVAANSSAMFNIPKNQVLHLSENRGFFSTGNRDVSGVIVTANKPVAVYTGATIINIPDEPIRVNPPAGCTATDGACTLNDECCTGICGYSPQTGSWRCAEGLPAGDHVEQQLFPVEAWGTTYVATPYWSRGQNDFTIYRVVGATDGTMVTLDPPVNGEASFTLNRGEVRQIYGRDSFQLTATQPVMLAQFMIGGSSDSSGDGDPAFLIPPALEQYRDSYVFLVPGQYRKNFVTLVKKVGVQVDLDGVAVSQALFQPVGGASMWEYAIVDNVTAGVHRATASEPFGVVVHGMDEYISYAFAGGITLPE